MSGSPTITTTPSLNRNVSHLLTPQLPHPSIPRANLTPPQPSVPRPTPQLPPPSTVVASHHHYHQISSTHIAQPTFTSSPLPSPQLNRSPQVSHAQLNHAQLNHAQLSPANHNESHQVPTSHISAYPSVIPNQSTLSRQICNPISALHRPVGLSQHPIQSPNVHPRPDLPGQPGKYRRLEATTHIAAARRISQPQIPAQPPMSRPIPPGINAQYETISARDDGYSTGSRETAPAPDGFEDDNDVEAPYTCAHCAARFSDREQRKTHIKAAHGKPFVCNSCQSRFTRKFDLEKHSLTVHEGMRPFQCDICNACFGQKHHLVRHKRAVHVKARDFACDACSSRFARKEHLGNHKRAVHEKHKPYMCSLCDVQYYERRALRKHLEQVHSVKSSRAPLFVDWQPTGNGSAPSIRELVQM